MYQNHGYGVIYHNKFKYEDTNVVFFNLQTGGLNLKSDVLQLGLRCGKKSFNQYVTPSKPIPSEITRINGLSNVGRTLYCNGQEVYTLSLRQSVRKMLDFLDELGGPCILVSHSAHFHVRRMKRIISICRLHYRFYDIFDGYVDTLSLFRTIFPDRKKQGQMTLRGLAEYVLPFSLLYDYNACYNCFLLQQLVYRKCDYDDLMDNLKDW